MWRPLFLLLLLPPRAVQVLLAAAALTLAWTPGGHAQTLDVLHVRGSVTMAGTSTPLVPGMRIQAADTLRFAAPTDRVYVVSPERGRQVLQPTVGNTQSVVLRVVRSILVDPVQQRRSLSTRAAGRPHTLEDLRAYFGSAPFVLLGPASVPHPAPCCVLTDSTFFYVRYRWQGQTINKRLPERDGRARLLAGVLYRVDGQPIASSHVSNAELMYYKTDASYSIADLHLVVPDEAAVRQEVAVLLRHVQGQRPVTHEAVVASVADYLEDTRGRVDTEALRAWLRDTF